MYDFQLRVEYIPGHQNVIADRGLISPLQANPHPPNSVGVPHQPATGLAVAHLERLAEDLISLSLAASTRRSYEVGQSEFMWFCTQLGVPVPALPTSRY